MGLNQRCPKCGSSHVQLSSVQSKLGCLWFVLFGWLYLLLVIVKWCIGILLLVCIDWWVAIIKSARGKGYVWKSKGWFSGKRKYYYCHDCHYNFKG